MSGSTGQFAFVAVSTLYGYTFSFPTHQQLHLNRIVRRPDSFGASVILNQEFTSSQRTLRVRHCHLPRRARRINIEIFD